jgi:hypothetical protein
MYGCARALAGSFISFLTEKAVKMFKRTLIRVVLEKLTNFFFK